MVSSLSLDPAWESEKEIFDKVRQYLRPGPWFRFITYLYAERQKAGDLLPRPFHGHDDHLE
jgi:hypothetical protein